MKFVLPSLKYNYSSMEPFIDKETMKIHHTQHHQSYVNNSNNIIANLSEFSKFSENELLKNLKEFPSKFITLARNNIGGHVNHSLFWKILKIGTSIEKKQIKIAITNSFGSINEFKEIFEKVSLSCFGSGWSWLLKREEKLSIVCTANQDNPFMDEQFSGVSGYPILGLDLWEHAYYLKYKNRRLDYIKAFWKVLNWEEVELRFLNSK